MSGPVVRLQGVTKTYRNGAEPVMALRGIDFEVREGDFVVIHGPSGSGKSTLLHIMGCLDRPTAGRVEVQGTDVGTLGARRLAELRRKDIGFVFQTFNLLPVLSAFENVEYPLLLNRWPRRERRRRVMEVLESVGMAGLGHRRPDQLSGGQKQRVAIARALVHRPGIVLADEPTANLDSDNGQAVLELLSQLNRSTGVAVVVVTHDPLANPYARRMVRMRDGKLTEVNG
ncbi:ABC transporter ATP-binding protein [Carboxydochorda subterranea]|uniref:ABC transporter ATP-binding protein n=1 Tax=Carboxydichorda subterranea TaxID=3109565 RepID=A0ABZ1BWP9_9FIRM|nr:ABC transporter ATP-binding protein [Limnochorda sp. L945t]WRP17229.1 ABC transporter ATP-binding protein [Limnochorda sp. L945t]